MTVCRLSSNYTDSECNFFIDLLENIVKDEESSLSKIRAINLCSSNEVTRKRAEELIEAWAKQNYFSETSERISIGPRCVGEFGGMLVLKFPDSLSACTICKQLVLKVIRPIQMSPWNQRFVFRERNVLKRVAAYCTRTAGISSSKSREDAQYVSMWSSRLHHRNGSLPAR